MSATIFTLQNLTTFSERTIFGFHCLMTNVRMLSGCHSAFPSDLVPINNIQRGWQHLSEHWRTGAISPQESCWVTLTRLHTHIRTQQHLERIATMTHCFLCHCQAVVVFGHHIYWCNIGIKTENTDMLQAFWTESDAHIYTTVNETTGCFIHHHAVCFHGVSVNEGWVSHSGIWAKMAVACMFSFQAGALS